ncbi:hypothetical protein [Sulfidibacter corallicola]|uniref:Uncharacterized protein n=1 Tax=Sulfidibacter corallicola TaxID=2818388 RepID=A0A8A4TKA2_SULCO|nr:hypothetical protein [Sulfidibacter corallicola]QTD49634.1 hypothetical protein J3U87_28950 [Sulfidibacter corallicola]
MVLGLPAKMTGLPFYDDGDSRRVTDETKGSPPAIPKSKGSRKKKKTKAPAAKPAATGPLSAEVYHKYHLALLEGLEANPGHFVYWDLGSGERPQKVKADFEWVAHKEGIVVRVLLAPGGQSLRFAYLESGIQFVGIRVIGSDGQVRFKG